jgi:hypothetical protein
MLTAPDQEFPKLVRHTFSETMLPNLPDASLWAVRVDPAYRWRFALARVLFGATEAPELLERSPEDFEGFSAARELSSNLAFGLEAELGIPMLVCAPWVLGLSSARVGGAVAILFGVPLAGIRDTPVAELIDLLRPQVPASAEDLPESPPRPNVQPESFAQFFRWWVERLNALWGVVLDPARFVDAAGYHDPQALFGTILSLERLFTSLQALLAASFRDDFQRRALLFDILDLLDGLRFGSLDTLLTMRRARAALDRVRAAGGGVAGVAMPKCEKAVDALGKVADGFYIKERRVDGRLRVKRKTGDEWEEISMENAVAAYLRVLRNSTHSFLGATKDQRELSLLAAHTGQLPEALPDLALVHVLDMLLAPERLIRPSSPSRR